MSSRALLVGLTGLAIAAAAACGPDAEPNFPEDYLATYQEVRDCRRSIDHDFKHIRVLASPEALAPYRDRDASFPVDAILVKEQYSEDDDACAGEIVDWTVMVKLEDGASPATIDWEWQKVNRDRSVADADVARCAGCHSDCEEPEGYLGTCAAEP